MSTPRNRQPAGAPTGGQFSTTSKAASGLALSEPAGSASGGALNHAANRLTSMWSAGVNDPEAETRIASVAVAGYLNEHYPDVATVSTEECDQMDCRDQHVREMYNAAGEPAQAPDGSLVTDGLEDDDALQDDLATLESGLRRSRVAGFELHGSERHGYSGTLDVAAALKPGSTEPTPSARATSMIDSYRARYDDLDVDDATAARDMLTDLHHWARANGHDFDELVTAAGEVADEEAAPGP